MRLDYEEKEEEKKTMNEVKKKRKHLNEIKSTDRNHEITQLGFSCFLRGGEGCWGGVKE